VGDISQCHRQTDNIEKPFADNLIKLIPLEHGIEDRYGKIPVLSLPSPPPLPLQPPPELPPAPAPPAAAVPAPAETQSMQGMFIESFKFLSEELGNTFSDTLGRLNNSLLKGLDGLREHMTNVTGAGPLQEEEYDDDYHEEAMEEGELRENVGKTIC